MANGDRAATFTYKKLDDIAIRLELYPPSSLPGVRRSDVPATPAIIYFHGGGLTVGSAKSWFPTWLKGVHDYRITTVHGDAYQALSCHQDRVVTAGFVFISAEYRLIPPSTAHDIVEDLQDLFKFLSSEFNDQLRSVYPSLEVDANRIAVTGSSAGGLCAYLAAMHAKPRPVAVVGLYAMGGDLLVSIIPT